MQVKSMRLGERQRAPDEFSERQARHPLPRLLGSLAGLALPVVFTLLFATLFSCGGQPVTSTGVAPLSTGATPPAPPMAGVLSATTTLSLSQPPNSAPTVTAAFISKPLPTHSVTPSVVPMLLAATPIVDWQEIAAAVGYQLYAPAPDAKLLLTRQPQRGDFPNVTGAGTYPGVAASYRLEPGAVSVEIIQTDQWPGDKEQFGTAVQLNGAGGWYYADSNQQRLIF